MINRCSVNSCGLSGTSRRGYIHSNKIVFVNHNTSAHVSNCMSDVYNLEIKGFQWIGYHWSAFTIDIQLLMGIRNGVTCPVYYLYN